MPLLIGAHSRLLYMDVVNYKGVETYGRWKPPSFLQERPADEFIGSYTVTAADEGRPDSIAFDLYGSEFLDWILIAFNSATDVNWPPAGSVIKYPIPALVSREID